MDGSVTPFVRHRHGQDNASSASPWCESLRDAAAILRLPSEAEGVAGSVVTRREGSNSLGTAPLWWPRALAKLGCCSSSELLNLRKGLHTAKVLRSSRIDSCCNL